MKELDDPRPQATMPFRRLWRGFAGRKPGRKRARGTRGLSLEQLETRQLLAGDLEILSAGLIDFREQPMATPFVGEQVFVRAEWREFDSLSANYSVRFEVDGVTQDSVQFTPSPLGFVTGGKGLGTINIAGRTAGVTFAMRGGWFAGPGTHNVVVTVDPTNAVAETSETNNSIQFSFTTVLPTTLPAQLLWPVGGVQNRDWGCCNYVDVDNLPGTAHDYRGNAFGLDGHAGYDIGGVNFARMDAGIPVFTSAAGRVTSVEDGHFDRVGSGQTSSDGTANQLSIDHGNGWETLYGHMANGLAVAVGDFVSPGQLLGYLGSSGGTNAAHLHWELHHFGGLVEPGFAASTFFATPRPYQLDMPTGIKDAGLTNVGQGGGERFSEIDSIPRGAAGTITAWTTYSHFRAGDVLTTKWIRPDGTLRNTRDSTFNDNAAGSTLFAVLPIGFFDASGRWQWVQEINDFEAFRVSFDVVDGVGSPEVRVTQDALEILDERTTPLDFGTVASGGSPPQKTFTIHNHGFAVLNVSSPVMPPGFLLAGAFPNVIAAGQNADFTVQLDTAVAGAKFGEIRFTNNDSSESLFNFNVAGMVTGANAAGTPQLWLPGPAVGYAFGQAPVLIDRQATLTDSDSATFAGGSVVVELAGGGTSNDRLGIRSSGDGPGQISVTGNEVRFDGTVIGAHSGGSGTTPLTVQLNSTATLSGSEALLRSIEYSNVAAAPATRPRYVRFSAIDDTGKASNQPVKKVMLAAFEVNVAPRVANAIADQVVAEDSAFSFTLPAAAFVDDNSFDPTLAFSAQRQGGGALPGWLSFDAASGRFSGTPGNDDVGSFVVAVTAADRAGLSASDDFEIRVNDTNDPPFVANPIAGRSTNEDALFDFTFAGNVFADIDAGDVLTYVAALSSGQPLPAWLSFEPVARRFQGTPTNDDVGELTIRVTATDTAGAAIADDWKLTVVNVNDPPVVMNPIPDQAVRQDESFVFTFDANAFGEVDAGDALIYSAARLTGLPLPAWLTFNPATRTFSGTPRNGDVGTLEVRVTANDTSQASAVDEFAIEVQNVNDAPDRILLSVLSVNENLAGAFVADLTVSDPDPGDTHEVTVSDTRFEIAAGQLRLKVGISLDHELEQTIDLLIRATDNGEPPLKVERSFTIAVADINEFPPEIADASFNLAENTAAGTVIGRITASDADVFQTLTLAITDGNVGEAFELRDGQLTVRDASQLDFESVQRYQLEVTATDNGSPANSSSATITINLIDVNEFSPVAGDQSFALDENSPAGSVAGTIAAFDDDTSQQLTFRLLEGNLGNAFTLDAQSGVIAVAAGATIDHEAVTRYLLTVEVSDNGNQSRSATALMTIDVRDVNEFTPLVPSQQFSVDENSSAGTVIGVITAQDGDTSQSLALTIAGGNDDGTFSLNPATGELIVATPEALDHEAVAQRTLLITATDSGSPPRFASNSIVVNILDANEPPRAVETIGEVRVLANVLFSATLPSGAFSDPDANDQLSVTLTRADRSPLPNWLSFNPASLALSGAATTAEVGEIELLLTASDSGNPPLEASQRFVVAIEANPAPWLNVLQPQDVNRDGIVSPLDALLGINALNAGRFIQQGNRLPLPFDPTQVSFDVNGDGILSPIDILLVVNHLNQTPHGEAEAILPPMPTSVSSFSPCTDDFLGSELQADGLRHEPKSRASVELVTRDRNNSIKHSVHFGQSELSIISPNDQRRRAPPVAR